jgi:hypothetical protein
MDEIARLIKNLRKLLRNIPEEDRYEILKGVDINELKEELGSWFIANYPLYQGS